MVRLELGHRGVLGLGGTAEVGTLPLGVEELLWELAEGRVPVSADGHPAPSLKTLHVVTKS